MREMTRDEWWRFASAGTKTGMLGVVDAQGIAHVTPVWFILNAADEGDELIFVTGRETAKGKALRRDPRFRLCVDDPQPPYSFVQLTTEARLVEDPDEIRTWASRIGARYIGEERGKEFGEQSASPSECLVRATITKVIALDRIAD